MGDLNSKFNNEDRSMKQLLQFAVLCIALISGYSSADQKNPELNELFILLHESTDPHEATVITDKIWQNWYQTDNAEIEGLMEQGEASMRVGKLKEAVESYTEVIKLDPEFAEGWNRRATIYYMMGKYQLSTADVDQTLKLEPRHFGALSGQGMIYTQLEEAELALEFYQRALEMNPHMLNVKFTIEAIKKHIQKELI